jgi:hypothetical protein
MGFNIVVFFPVWEMALDSFEGCCENSWSSCYVFGQVGALEPWRKVGRPEGLCAVKRDPIP